MARIAGVNIPDRKHAVIALTSIYGIGLTRSRQICAAANVAEDRKIMELTGRNRLFDDPLHPYTQSLNSAVPVPNPRLERRRRSGSRVPPRRETAVCPHRSDDPAPAVAARMARGAQSVLGSFCGGSLPKPPAGEMLATACL